MSNVNLNLALMEKASFLALMEYNPMVYSPNEKGVFLWKIIFLNGNGYGKR